MTTSPHLPQIHPLPNRFRADVLARKRLIGLWSSLGQPVTSEIIGLAGFDWLLLDGEHSPNDVLTFAPQLMALKDSASAAVVRPPWNDPVMLKRLLDIGCGWDGLARYAALKYGVEGLGVTLSKNQKAYADEQIARAGLQDRVAVEMKDYRDLGEVSFDKVVSVGMFEHVGRSHLPEYFAQVYRLIKPGGLFLNHGISRRAGTEVDQQSIIQQRIFGSGSFLQKYIFPDGELIPVSEVNLKAENAGFEVRDVENLREHYALTLRHWVNRLAARYVEAVKASDEVTYRTWRLYMSASAHGFESGSVNVNQTLLAKMVSGKRNVPLSRADLYTA